MHTTGKVSCSADLLLHRRPATQAGTVQRVVGNLIRGVSFQPDSGMHKHESTLVLDALTKTLQARPVPRLQIIGHSSAERDTRYNLELSTRRTGAVRDWLVFRGVPAGSPGYAGYGEQYPLTSNMIDAGRRVNRRVELAPVLASAY